MSAFDLAKEIDRLADADAPDGSSCPKRPERPCVVEDWVYETESIRPRIYGWCTHCDTAYIVVLPRRRGSETDAATLRRIHTNNERATGRACDPIVIDATERALRRSGIAQALPEMFETRMLALTREVLLKVYNIAFKEMEARYYPRERLLTELLDSVYKRIAKFEDDRRKLAKHAMRADIVALQEKLVDLRRQTTAARQELATVRGSLREALQEIRDARAEARREPLPMPPDYVPPSLVPGAVLCDAIVRREVIYALVDSGDPELVRYVGRTSNPESRYSAHCGRSSAKVSTWAAGVRAAGRRPTMVLIEECAADADVAEREAYWIHYYRDRFQADLNSTVPARVEEMADAV